MSNIVLRKIKINSSLLLLSLIIFRLLLDISYIFYVEPNFCYKGFFLDVTPLKYLISFFFLIIFHVFLDKSTSKASGLLLQFFFILVYIPFTSYFALSNQYFGWFFIFSLFWLIAIIIQKGIQFKKIPPLKISEYNIFLGVGVTVIFIFLIIFNTADLTFNMNINDVYELRAVNPTGNIPYSGYFINWTAKVFLPFLIVFTLVRFKPSVNMLFIISILLTILLFSVTGHKGYLFAIPMLIGTVLLLKAKNVYLLLLLILSSLIITGLIIMVVFNDNTIMTLFVRRMLYMPAQISYYYYDFFEGSPVLLSNSIMSGFFSYPHQLEPAYLIGDLYYQKPDMSANNGIITDGFMHFGVVGVIVWAIIFSFILKLIDSLIFGKSYIVLIPILLIGLRSFIDGALLTSLLTHGFFLTIFLCYLYPRKS